jgi:hypothetical protein
MKVLTREKTFIVHLVATNHGIEHALCSPEWKYPRPGEKSKRGTWIIREMEPGEEICSLCQAKSNPPKQNAWERLTERGRKTFEMWEQVTGTMHKDDPRKEKDATN